MFKAFVVVCLLFMAAMTYLSFFNEDGPKRQNPEQYALFSMHYDGDSKTITWAKLADFENPTACTATAEKLREASTEYLKKMNLPLPNGIFPYTCLGI